MTDLSTLIGSSNLPLDVATGINDRGQIVANGSKGAALLTPTSTTMLVQAANSTPTSTAGPPIVSSGGKFLASPVAGSGIDPALFSVALSPSPFPATPIAVATPTPSFTPTPLLTLSLTSNLPRADSSQSGQTAEAASDRIFADLDGGLSLARFVEGLAQVGESSTELTPAKPRQ
jgi:hypothetical protein